MCPCGAACVRVCMNCFHCQTTGPIRLKFGMWSPSTCASVINHMWEWQRVWLCHNQPIGSHFDYQKLIKGPIMPKFGMWSPNTWPPVGVAKGVVLSWSHPQEVVLASKS